jgi:hypothetical protein
MIKKSSYLLLKGDIHASHSGYFFQCTDMNLYSLKIISKLPGTIVTVCHQWVNNMKSAVG